MIRDLMFNFVIFGIMQTGAELFRKNLVMRIDQNWSGFMEKCNKILYHKVDIFSISTFSKYWVIETWQIMFKYKSIDGL